MCVCNSARQRAWRDVFPRLRFGLVCNDCNNEQAGRLLYAAQLSRLCRDGLDFIPTRGFPRIPDQLGLRPGFRYHRGPPAVRKRCRDFQPSCPPAPARSREFRILS
jgi:hypothetical protein